MKNIISLGAGVQSSMILLASKKAFWKEIPDAAIFADTQSEPKKVYDWLAYLEREVGSEIKIYKVTNGNVGADGLVVHTSKKSGKTYIKSIIPAFVLQPNGKKGLLGRKCTADYKVKVIIKKVNELIGAQEIKDWKKKFKQEYKDFLAFNNAVSEMKRKNKAASKKVKAKYPEFPFRQWEKMQSEPLAASWIGISSDEADRMKPSKIPWIVNRWPLIEKNLTRKDCVDWMLANGYPEPPRSACIFCPFHSDEEWQRIRNDSEEEFQAVIKYEKDLQAAARNQTALTGVPYLHPSCKPLSEIDFGKKTLGYQQLNMFGNECEGLCGV